MNQTKDFFILLIGRILLMLSSIISIRIITTFLSPYEIGRLNIFISIISWFNFSVVAGVGMYVNRRFIEWVKLGKAKRNIMYFGLYRFFVAILSILFLILLQYFLEIGIQVEILWLLGIVSGSILLIGCSTDFINFINLLGDRFWFVAFSVLNLWVGLGIAIYLVNLHPTAEYWLSAQLITSLIFLILIVIKLSQLLKDNHFVISDFDRKDFNFSDIFNFAWPYSIGTFLYWCHSQGYRFVFQKIAGTEALGLFAVGFGIGSNLMVAFDTLFNQYYHPIFYNEIANSSEEQRTIAWNKYGSFFFPAIIIMVVYIGVNGPLLAKLFTGERFHYVGNIILWGAVAESLRMMTSATAMVSHAQLEMKPLIIPSIVGAVSAIIGVFILVRFNPFLGGGFAISFGWLLAFLVLFKNMKKLLPIEFPYKRVLYSIFLSLPFFVLLSVKKTDFMIIQSLIILVVSGLYLIFAQFILARKWISLPLRLSFIDEWENKFKNYFSQITNL